MVFFSTWHTIYIISIYADIENFHGLGSLENKPADRFEGIYTVASNGLRVDKYSSALGMRHTGDPYGAYPLDTCSVDSTLKLGDGSTEQDSSLT